MTNLRWLSRKAPSLIGMIHVDALPGAPRSRRSIQYIANRAANEAAIVAHAGFDAVMVENMHDAPYVTTHGPEVPAFMTLICLKVRDAVGDLPMGVQVLACGERQALSAALAAGGQFIRCENFVFSHVADEGLMPRAAAGELLRFRSQIGADHIRILADIKKKHASHAITADISLNDTAQAAEFFLADGVIVTGAATGQPVDVSELEQVRAATSLPVLVGSGAAPAQADSLRALADGIIVGSWIKRAGRWTNAVDERRCEMFLRAFRS